MKKVIQLFWNFKFFSVFLFCFLFSEIALTQQRRKNNRPHAPFMALCSKERSSICKKLREQFLIHQCLSENQLFISLKCDLELKRIERGFILKQKKITLDCKKEYMSVCQQPWGDTKEYESFLKCLYTPGIFLKFTQKCDDQFSNIILLN